MRPESSELAPVLADALEHRGRAWGERNARELARVRKAPPRPRRNPAVSEYTLRAASGRVVIDAPPDVRRRVAAVLHAAGIRPLPTT